MRCRILRVLAAGLLLWAAAAAAHKPSDSYLAVTVGPAAVGGQWDIALRDLDFAIGLDADGDGRITWGELRARHDAVAAYALSRLTLAADGAACPLRATDHLVDSHTDGAYAVLRFAADCPPRPGAPQQLQITYRLFADVDPQHRGLLRLEAAGRTRTAVFSPEQPTQAFALAASGGWAQFGDYFGEGVWHIWIGIDHILFLVSLLLPAVLLWRDGWAPVARFHEAWVDVLKIVTSFTVAHSITLSLATLGFVELPSRWVESTIAASVALAALNNLRPVVRGRRWAVAFGFGLVHGFGFASVLADLGLQSGTLALALVGFNVGVEAGQVAIVAVFLPLAFALRRTAFYRGFVCIGGSVAIALVAAAWFVERAFDLKLLPF